MPDESFVSMSRWLTVPFMVPSALMDASTVTSTVHVTTAPPPTWLLYVPTHSAAPEAVQELPLSDRDMSCTSTGSETLRYPLESPPSN